MATFTTIVLENLLEPRVQSSLKSDEITKNPIIAAAADNNDQGKQREKEQVPAEAERPKHIYISSALYVTPEPEPIPEFSSEYPASPSLYLANQKRRECGRRIGEFEIPSVLQQEEQQEERESDLELNLGEEEEDDNFFGVEVKDEEFTGVESENKNEIEIEDENESFLDPIGSSSNRFESHSFVSAQADFSDAIEEFSSDGSLSSATSHYPSIESELRMMRLSLLEEMERRNIAEDALKVMKSRWQIVRNLLFHTGLSFPEPPQGGSMDHDIISLEQFAQEVVVARSVAIAVGRGEARDEAELAAHSILETKEQEISRLRDRLQYYEAVNHEMSHRNQEIMEVARRQRQRKKTQQKWLWSGVGLSIAIGAAILAYSDHPSSNHQPLPTSSNSADSSAVSSSETA